MSVAFHQLHAGMPTNVRRFELLSYLALVLGIPPTALNWDRFTAIGQGELSKWFIILTTIAVFAVLAWLIWLAARRRKKWARWVLFVWLILYLPVFFWNLPDVFAERKFADLFVVVQLVLQVSAMWFAFTGNARAWYSRQA
jgi:hypothetical protein